MSKSFYICIVADHTNPDGGKVKGRDIYLSLMSKNAWGLHPTVASRAKLKKGDGVVFYLGGNYEFLGTAEVASEPYQDKTGKSKDWYLNTDTYRVDLENIDVWSRPKPIKPLLGLLSFVKNAVVWGAYLQGGIRKITDADFKCISESTDYRSIITETETSLASFLSGVDFTATQFAPHALDNPAIVKIRAIIENVESGWRIPNFQRYFDWDKEAIRSFLESIFNDYYVGAFLLWKSSEEAPSELELIPIEGVENSKSRTEYIILDGQQRMTALYYAIKSPHHSPEGLTKKCYYYIDFKTYLEKGESEGIIKVENEILGNEQAFERLWFPLNKLENYSQWINDLEDYLNATQASTDPDKIRNLRRTIEKRLAHIWNDFGIPYVVLPKTMRLAQVADIFERINTKGKPLSVFDLLIARLLKYKIELRKLWVAASQQNVLIKRYGKKVEKIKIYIFQIISLLYHPANSVKRKDVLNIYENLSLNSSSEFDDFWKTGVFSLEASLSMLENLRDGFGVRSESDVPFLPMVPVLAALLNEAGRRENKAVCYEKIRQWYWSAVFTNAYSSGADTQMTADFKDVVTWFDDETSIPRVVRQARKEVDSLDLLEITQAGNAIYRGVLCLIAMQGAYDFESGLTLENSRENDKDHIFPRSVSHGFGRHPNVESVLNMTWLSKATNIRKSAKKPSAYIPDFITAKYNGDELAFKEKLKGHFIDDEAYDCLAKDDFDGFVAARNKLIKREIKKQIGGESRFEAALEEEPVKLVDDLEAKIRKFLDAKLTEAHGPNYWNNLSSGVRQRVEEKLKQRVKRHPNSSNDMPCLEKLSFCDIMDYSEIVLSNWIIFEKAFGSKAEVEKHFLNLKEYRNALKHGRTMNNIERKQGEASLEWVYLIVNS
jgi:hypothetical protein